MYWRLAVVIFCFYSWQHFRCCYVDIESHHGTALSLWTLTGFSSDWFYFFFSNFALCSRVYLISDVARVTMSFVQINIYIGDYVFCRCSINLLIFFADSTVHFCLAKLVLYICCRVVQKSIPECLATSYVEKVSCQSSSSKDSGKAFTRRYSIRCYICDLIN